MAGEIGSAPTRLTPQELLSREPGRFNLFAALRLLEQKFAGRPRLGESRRASDDGIRLGHVPYLTFARSDVATFQEGDAGVPRLEQHSFGLFGPNGPLPAHMTELAYERRRHVGDAAIVDFLNVFQHRLISLFYRAWANSDPATSFDRPDSDRFRMYVGALLGMAPVAACDRDTVSDYAKLSRAALFAQQTRSAPALQAILADYFRLPAEVRQFTGEWLTVPSELRCRLGLDPATLGDGAFLGGALWRSQHKFEIVLGPLTLSRLEGLLPGARGLRELVDLVRLFTNDEWTWQLRLLLLEEEIPRTRLGLSGKLGWVSWLGAHRGVADDVVIQECSARASRKKGRARATKAQQNGRERLGTCRISVE
jgi:type VI secretion system protein ImpH